jgi:hypothetical protein
MPAARLHLEPAGGKVDLVVEDRDVGWLDLEEPHGLAHRLPGEVHERLGLEQRDPLRPQPPFRHVPLELRPPRPEAVIFGYPLHGHEADVVAVPGVLPARIPESHEKAHGSRSALSMLR